MPKLRCTWKDPDFDIREVGKSLRETDEEAVREAAFKFGLGEYLTLELDTDQGSITVLRKGF